MLPVCFKPAAGGWVSLSEFTDAIAELIFTSVIPLTMLRKDICHLFGGDMCFVQINVLQWETGGMGWLRELWTVWLGSG